MSVLAQNMETIRRELRCTQSAMSAILKVGFRTYVRYEAGERDAPVAVLVKMARLGNISLETLLTQKIENLNILPMDTETLDLTSPEVKSVNFQTGQISFKKMAKEGLLTMNDGERNALSAYRRLPAHLKQSFIKELEKTYKGTGSGLKALKITPSSPTPVILVDEEAKAKPVATSSPKRKGRPGRKKLDKKALREKIDRLKVITKSVPKITVR